MNPSMLAGLLKRAYPKFDMTTFSNRLKLQKFVYLLQRSGMSLGYDFYWYLYGPYSTELTRDAFQIENFDKIEPMRFPEAEIETKFSNFIDKLGQLKDDDKWMEIASSIDILRSLYPNKSKQQIIKEIEQKQEYFKGKEKFIEKVWDDLETIGLK